MGENNARECDAGLVEAALAGGPSEFGAIVERYQDAVFAVVLARLRRFHDAEDVAQSVFLDAYGRLDKLKDAERLGAWLRSIAIHKSIDHLRRRKKEVDIHEAVDGERSASAWQKQSERRELRDEVMAAIERLSKTQRETTTLFYINGYSVEEVAAIQEVPAGTVKGRLHDARKRLKEEMIGMVEQVLKSEAPKPDFAARVFEIVNRYHPTTNVNPNHLASYEEIVAELRRIGTDGIEGFVKAVESPHGDTRAFAVSMIERAKPTGEIVVDLLKKAIDDPSRKVRRCAVDGLLYPGGGITATEERRRTEFVPLVVPLLKDHSEKVRCRAAWVLEPWAGDVPIEIVAEALLEVRSPLARRCIRSLLRKVINARKVSGDNK